MVVGGWGLVLLFLLEQTVCQSSSESRLLFLSGAAIFISNAIDNHKGKVVPKKASGIRRFLFLPPQVKAN